MERANVDGITLEYEVQGSGDPVVLIHGGFVAAAFATLMTEAALSDRFTLIRYHRRGYAGSSPHLAPLSISGQAADCLGLLRQLGGQRAHLVGHSYGGAIALQLALDAPEAVRSLSLLEPALLDVPSGPKLAEKFERATQMYEAGDKAGQSMPACRPYLAKSIAPHLMPPSLEDSSKQSQMPTQSSARKGRRFRSGRSAGKMPHASTSRSSLSWGQLATLSSARGTSYCSNGSPRPNRSSCPGQAIPCSLRIPEIWRGRS